MYAVRPDCRRVLSVGFAFAAIALLAGCRPNNAPSVRAVAHSVTPPPVVQGAGRSVSPKATANPSIDTNVPIVFATNRASADALTAHRGNVTAVYITTNPAVQATPVASMPQSADLHWSADRKYLFVINNGPTVLRYDSNERTFTLVPGTDPSLAAGFHASAYAELPEPDASLAYVSSEDHLLSSWNVESDISRDVHLPPSLTVLRDAVLSPDGAHVAFTADSRDPFPTSDDEKYRDLWILDISGNQRLRRLGHGASPHWSPDSMQIVAIDGSTYRGNRIFRYDARTGHVSTILKSNKNRFESAAFSPSGRSIAVYGSREPARPYRSGLFLITPDGKFIRTILQPNALKGMQGEGCKMDW